jgi:D-3-phosphoglycerate dehydrogenase
MVQGRVLVADPLHPDAIEQLHAAGLDVVQQTEITAKELLKTIDEFDVLIVRGRTKVTREVIAAGKHLKVIARSGVGLDNVDRSAAQDRGIHVINSPEGPSVSVAELVFALMLSVLRKVSFSHHGMRTGNWLKKASRGSELRNRTLGIWGFGFIGEEVAKRAQAFQMRVFAFDLLEDRIRVMKKLGVEYKPIEELLPIADILTVHVPLTPRTQGLIGKKEIAALPAKAIIINTARGGIVDESALYEGLVSGHLGGAGLDVFSEEPPFSDELLKKLIALDNVVSTPHIGAQTAEASRANSMVIAEKVLKLLE